MDRESGQRLLFAEETYAVRGCIFEVHREMGGGFLEAVYHECLGLEFAARLVPFRSKPQVGLNFKGSTLTQVYVPDFVCFDSIIVELKAVRELTIEHQAPVMNYLRATGLRVGLLVNFAGLRVAIQRVAL